MVEHCLACVSLRHLIQTKNKAGFQSFFFSPFLPLPILSLSSGCPQTPESPTSALSAAITGLLSLSWQ